MSPLEKLRIAVGNARTYHANMRDFGMAKRFQEVVLSPLEEVLEDMERRVRELALVRHAIADPKLRQ